MSLKTLSRPLAVYVHWPYCSRFVFFIPTIILWGSLLLTGENSKCTYCAFNKYIVPFQDQNHERMEACLVAELKQDLTKLNGASASSVYFGGGTPSLARPQMVEKILNVLGPRLQVEVTLEMNPSSAEMQKIKDFQRAGVNRLSMGVQSLNDSVLQSFGRDHSVSEALEAISKAKTLFTNISLDFIYGRPNQTLEQWKRELDQILDLGANHLSLYNLMVERGTPLFNSVAQKKLQMPDSDLSADMYELTVELCNAKGMPQYEVSSFAKDRAFYSQHNLSYWKGIDYIGIGPGAHGRTTLPSGQKMRTFRILEPQRWMNSCDINNHGLAKSVSMSATESFRESLVFGLRIVDGLILENGHFEILKKEKLDELCDRGLLKMEGNHLKPSSRGLAVMDAIIQELIL